MSDAVDPDVLAYDSAPEDTGEHSRCRRRVAGPNQLLAGSPCLLDVPEDGDTAETDALDRIVHESLAFYLDDDAEAPRERTARRRAARDSDEHVSLGELREDGARIPAVVCAVLQVGPVHTVSVRATGELLPLAALLVGDPSRSYVRVVLWRGCSEWSGRLVPGCVVRLTALKVRLWRGVVSCSSTPRTCVVPLYDPRTDGPHTQFSASPFANANAARVATWDAERHGCRLPAPCGPGTCESGPRLPVSSPLQPTPLASLAEGAVCTVGPCVALAVSRRALLVGDGLGSTALIRLTPSEAHWAAVAASHARSFAWEVRNVVPRPLSGQKGAYRHSYALTLTPTSELAPTARHVRPRAACHRVGARALADGRHSLRVRIVSIEFFARDGASCLVVHGADRPTADSVQRTLCVGCARCRLPAVQDHAGVYLPCRHCAREGSEADLAWMFPSARVVLSEDSSSTGCGDLRTFTASLSCNALASLLCGLPTYAAAFHATPFLLTGTPFASAYELAAEALWRSVSATDSLLAEVSVTTACDDNGYSTSTTVTVEMFCVLTN